MDFTFSIIYLKKKIAELRSSNRKVKNEGMKQLTVEQICELKEAIEALKAVEHETAAVSKPSNSLINQFSGVGIHFDS